MLARDLEKKQNLAAPDTLQRGEMMQHGVKDFLKGFPALAAEVTIIDTSASP